MDDMKLLKLAAKAAGIDLPKKPNPWFSYSDTYGFQWMNMDGSRVDKSWNPLNDDGDALRLSAKVKLDVMFFKGFGEVIVESNDASVRCSELYGADTMPATRRAIVRAAAEIGRRVL